MSHKPDESTATSKLATRLAQQVSSPWLLAAGVARLATTSLPSLAWQSSREIKRIRRPSWLGLLIRSADDNDKRVFKATKRDHSNHNPAESTKTTTTTIVGWFVNYRGWIISEELKLNEAKSFSMNNWICVQLINYNLIIISCNRPILRP